jgi:hypothetical protein
LLEEGKEHGRSNKKEVRHSVKQSKCTLAEEKWLVKEYEARGGMWIKDEWWLQGRQRMWKRYNGIR